MQPRASAAVLTAVLVLGLAGLTAIPAAATGITNRGTIKIHEEMTVEPATRNQPHVSCEFWVEGFAMAGASGDLVFTVWPPTADPDRDEVLRVDWATDGFDSRGHHFREGSFELAPGHYRVEAFADQGHPGDEEHFAKAKVFWVDECEAGGPGEGGPGERCPPGVSATALDNGAIELSWENTLGLNAFLVHRAAPGEDFVVVARLPASADVWVDTDTEVGVTYRYMVTGVVANVEIVACEILEVTAIPFFTSEVAMGAAGISGVAAYAVMRRRP